MGTKSQDGQRVLFVSLFMIMLAFFILLNSIAVIKEDKTKKAMKSVGGAFGQLPGGRSVTGKEGEAQAPNAPIPSDNPQQKMIRQLRRVFTGKLGKGAEVGPAPTGNGALVAIDGESNFTGDGTELPAGMRERLQQLTAIAQESDASVRIDGHTSLRQQTSWEDALWVSGRRAQNVAKVMNEAGMPANKIRLTGAGDLQPRAREYDADARGRNERVDIHLKIEEDTKIGPIFPEGEEAPVIRGAGGGEE